MSESEKADRRSRLVMALGIAAVILFSANLLAMVAKHIWPDLRELAIFGAETEAVVEVPEHTIEFHAFSEFDHKHRHSHKRTPHRIIIRRPHSASGTITFDSKSFEADLNRLERDMEREMALLEGKFSAVTSSKPFVYSISKGEGDVTVKFDGDFEFDGAETLRNQEASLNRALQMARDLSTEMEDAKVQEQLDNARAQIREIRVQADRAADN